MSKQRINITADGSTTLRISAAKKYITIDNDTDAAITVYDNVGMLNPANVLYEIKPYSARCYPVDVAQEGESLYSMTWNGATYPNYFDIMLTAYDTHNNLLYPQASASNVTIVADSVGVARADQLPATLSATGNLKVETNEPFAQLPAGLTGQGNLKVGVNETFAQLPTALTTNGRLKVDANEVVAHNWQKIYFAEAGDSASLGTDIALLGWECSSSQTAYPLDNTTRAWQPLNNKEFLYPLHITSTFKMHANASCYVWVLTA